MNPFAGFMDKFGAAADKWKQVPSQVAAIPQNVQNRVDALRAPSTDTSGLPEMEGVEVTASSGPSQMDELQGSMDRLSQQQFQQSLRQPTASQKLLAQRKPFGGF